MDETPSELDQLETSAMDARKRARPWRRRVGTGLVANLGWRGLAMLFIAVTVVVANMFAEDLLLPPAARGQRHCNCIEMREAAGKKAPAAEDASPVEAIQHFSTEPAVRIEIDAADER